MVRPKSYPEDYPHTETVLVEVRHKVTTLLWAGAYIGFPQAEVKIKVLYSFGRTCIMQTALPTILITPTTADGAEDVAAGYREKGF